MEIGEFIRDARFAQGFSQFALARVSGVSRRQIQKIENGYVIPRQETVAKLLKAVTDEG